MKITDETPIVMLTVGQLKELMTEILSIEVKEEPKDVFSMDEAVKYLCSMGYKITKSTLYLYTSKGEIDFHRMGERKIVFNTEQLDRFITKRMK